MQIKSKILKSLLGLIVCWAINSCSVDTPFNGILHQPDHHLLRNYGPKADRYVRQHLIDLLIEVALGAEYGSDIKLLKKWTTPMRLYVESDLSPELQATLFDVINEINVLCTDGFYIEQTTDSLSSNTYLYAGPALDFAKRFTQLTPLVENHNGLIHVAYNDAYEITRAVIYVDTQHTLLVEQKHVLREELTQGMGLLNDLKYYPESIFYEAQSRGDSFSTFDKELIRLLYHPAFYPGMDSLRMHQTGKRILGL